MDILERLDDLANRPFGDVMPALARESARDAAAEIRFLRREMKLAAIVSAALARELAEAHEEIRDWEDDDGK